MDNGFPWSPDDGRERRNRDCDGERAKRARGAATRLCEE